MISSYLNNRQYFVDFYGYQSDYFSSNSGIGQGSKIGPLLFLCFINDIICKLKFCKAQLFADDLKIFAPINSLTDCENLQMDIDTLSVWSMENKLDFNISKCAVMTIIRKQNFLDFSYQLNMQQINRVNSFKDLGIIFSSDFKFHNHIEYLIKQTHSTFGFIIRQSSKFSNPSTSITLYNSLVRSKLEYGCTLWSPLTKANSNRIEHFQKKLLKILHLRLFKEYPSLTSYTTLMNEFSILQTHRERRDIFCVEFIRKLCIGLINDPFLLSRLKFRVPRLESRFKNIFYDSLKNNRKLQSPLSIMMDMFNELNKIDSYDVFTNMGKKKIIAFNRQ